MVGQPIQRRWYETHDFPPGRPAINHDVRDLLSRIDPEGSPVDLGGSTSLNLLLKKPGLVLRVNKPFVTMRRIRVDQELRYLLAGQGLNIASPCYVARQIDLRLRLVVRTVAAVRATRRADDGTGLIRGDRPTAFRPGDG